MGGRLYGLDTVSKEYYGTAFPICDFFSFSGTFGRRDPSRAAKEPELPPNLTGDANVQKWVASELHFQSSVVYKKPFYDVDFDFIFKHQQSGTTLKVPAFWNGDQEFIVRYALTETGLWDFTIECSDASNPLNGQAGTLRCSEYSGEHEIYKRGFIKAEKRYFTYADGTPFFYLGDTHWHMVLEDYRRRDGIRKWNKSLPVSNTH